jgi:hypothetical protein
MCKQGSHFFLVNGVLYFYGETMLKRAFLSGLLLLAAALPLAAQEIGYGQSESSFNRLGVAIGVCGIASDRITPSLLLTAMYSRTIAQGLDLELSVQHTAGSRFSRYDIVSPLILMLFLQRFYAQTMIYPFGT